MMAANRKSYHERNPDAQRIAIFKHKPGLTLEGWAGVRAAQAGLC